MHAQKDLKRIHWLAIGGWPIVHPGGPTPEELRRMESRLRMQVEFTKAEYEKAQAEGSRLLKIQNNMEPDNLDGMAAGVNAGKILKVAIEST
jgi:hypothetical protein